MNTISIGVSILMPLVVVGYVAWDLISNKTVKSSVMAYGDIDQKIHDRDSNNGRQYDQKELLDNTDYLLDSYGDSFRIE
jgi:hypothetical protein